ncbi:site-specific integrase [Rhodomicrobium vannielii ATCC 17100]|nr:site-specific integrase [Rhodomicrobium vannielii ATCC 17100]
MATLRKRGFSPGGVKRIFASVKASIIYAWRREEIKGHPPFISLAEGGIRERILSIEELAALWDVCAKHHMQFFFIGLICTMARPNAVLALTTGQCDTARGIIDLHPIGRPRTKKRNPVIPLPDAMRPWLAAAGNGQFVTYADRGIHDVKKAWRAMRNDAGLDDAVVPYSIRHTMASELAARGVPELQIAAMLGHKAPNLRTTNRYIKFRPDYLAVSRKVIDEIVVEMGRLSTRPIVPEPSLRANCVSVTQDEDDKPLEVHEKKKKAPNSGEGWALLRFHACVGREADAERSMPSARRGGTTDGDWHQSLYAR